MGKDYVAITQNISEKLATFAKKQPETMAGFQAMMKGATKDSALDPTTKELIALGIAVSARCDGCIAFHTQKLIKLGVSEEAFLETLSMAVYMGGGPSLMYAAAAIEAYEQFTK